MYEIYIGNVRILFDAITMRTRLGNASNMQRYISYATISLAFHS